MEKKSKYIKLLKDYNAVAILLLLAIIATFFVDGFSKNIDRVIVEASLYGMIAVGLGLVMVTGNIDLSVGFQAACAAVLAVLVYNVTGGNLILAAIIAIISGIVTGFINGFTVVKLGISPLIATIATNYIYKGFVYFFTKDGAIYPEGELRRQFQNALSKKELFNVDALAVPVLIVIAVLVVLYFIMRKTRFGVSLYIAGDNAEAGQFAGIDIKKSVWITYILCGVCCALAGLFLASNAGSAIYSQGEGRDVFAISACIIGGIKMAGGKGTMVNLLLGILIMRVISTAMDMMLIPAAWVDFVSGALLIVILIIDRFTAVKKDA